MNTIFKKSVLAVSILVAVSSFISCDTSENKKGNNLPLIAEKTVPSSKEKTDTFKRKPVVFITGFDKGNEAFYSNARTYFQEKEYEITEGQYSLEEIILWLNKNVSQVPFGEIHIVNNGNQYTGINLEILINGDKVSTESVRKSITQGTLPTLNNVINSNSKIVFHASGLAKNRELITTLKDVFCNEENPKVITSEYHTVFGGSFSNHYLAQAYYVFYPTANSPGKIDLSKEISRKYSDEKDINWLDALQNKKERYVGEAYTTQFHIPIIWEFDYYNSDNEIPTFKNPEEIIEWIKLHENLTSELKKYAISADKFRWKFSVKNSKLTIRGRTTGLCVLKPLIKPYGDLKHIKPDTNNKRLYAMK